VTNKPTMVSHITQICYRVPIWVWGEPGTVSSFH